MVDSTIEEAVRYVEEQLNQGPTASDPDIYATRITENSYQIVIEERIDGKPFSVTKEFWKSKGIQEEKLQKAVNEFIESVWSTQVRDKTDRGAQTAFVGSHGDEVAQEVVDLFKENYEYVPEEASILEIKMGEGEMHKVTYIRPDRVD